jgi:hypothetical protein
MAKSIRKICLILFTGLIRLSGGRDIAGWQSSTRDPDDMLGK